VDWYFLVDRHLEPMTAIVERLGDELANTVPALPGANSPYQLVVHCCGVVEWWTRQVVLGVPVERDRDAELTGSGSVVDLRRRVDEVLEHLRTDLTRIDPDAALRGDPAPDYVGTPIGSTARGVLLHMLEELAQHHGHLEITRDVILRSRDG
jgi:hypothetical protein